MKNNIYLDFFFRGDRNYVRGDDIYKAMIEAISSTNDDVTDVIFSIHRHTIKHCKLLEDQTGVKEGDIIARLKCKTGKNTVRTFFIVETDKLVENNIEFNEEEIILASTLNVSENKISFKKNAKYTALEATISLNKHLLSILFTKITGKWIFTRLDAVNPKKLAGKFDMELRMTHNLANKLVKSDVLHNNTKIATIFFSVLEDSDAWD